MYTLLIVEDDPGIREQLASFLTQNGYHVIAPTSFDSILDDMERAQADLILLDLSLPGVDGHFLMREYKKKHHTPIIVVTSSDSSLDELMSMNLGADDYITKPYHPQILQARIQSVLRRTYQSQNSTVMSVNQISINFANATVQYAQESISLTQNEMKILHVLLLNIGSIVSRDELIHTLWDTDWFVDDNTLTVNMNRLRKKLETIHITDFIETKRGMGYIIHDV